MIWTKNGNDFDLYDCEFHLYTDDRELLNVINDYFLLSSGLAPTMNRPRKKKRFIFA